MRRRREQQLTLAPPVAPRAVVLYHHGFTEPHDRLLRDPDRTVTEALLHAGFLVASSTACGDSWGNGGSVDVNLGLWRALDRPDLPLGHLGVSMGCVVALNCAADGRFPSLAVGGIAPVCDVESVRPYRKVSPDAVNPMERDPRLWTGVSLRFWAADEEAPVSKALNADAFSNRVMAHARESAVVGCAGNHISVEQYQPDDVVAFFVRALGLSAGRR